jgi:hypothetical protein
MPDIIGPDPSTGGGATTGGSVRYPEMQYGGGVITPDVWSRLMGMLQWFEGTGGGSGGDSSLGSLKAQINRIQNYRTLIFARLTDKAALDTNRYKYAWEELSVSGSDTDHVGSAADGGLSGTTSADYAINLCELANDSSSVGPGISLGTGYPADFTMRAIGSVRDPAGGDDTFIGLAVPMWLEQDGGEIGGTAVFRPFFCLANAHDGTCP